MSADTGLSRRQLPVGGAAWYGRLEGERTELHPRHPVDVVGGARVSVLGLYGGEDRGIPLASVQVMRRKLVETPQDSEIVVFPTAPHGFHADYHPSFREAAAREGWERMLRWLGERGGGVPPNPTSAPQGPGTGPGGL